MYCMFKWLTFFLFHSLALASVAQNSLFELYQPVQAKSQAAVAQNDYQTAITTTEQFIQQHPKYSLAYLEQSSYAIKNRDVSLLKRNIVALKKQQINISLDLLLATAQLAEKKRFYQLGLEVLAQATPAQAKAEALLLQKASLQQKLNQQAAALTTLQEAYNNHSESSKVVQELAAAYQNVNRRRSIQLYEALLKKEGYEDIALTALGLLYTRLYEAEPSVNNRINLVKAKEYYQQYLTRHSNDKATKELLKQLDVLLEG